MARSCQWKYLGRCKQKSAQLFSGLLIGRQALASWRRRVNMNKGGETAELRLG